VTEIAVPAGWIVERAQSRRRAPALPKAYGQENALVSSMVCERCPTALV
jgi:hypothetical protein